MCLIADTTLLPTSDDRIVLKKLAEEVASFKCVPLATLLALSNLLCGSFLSFVLIVLLWQYEDADAVFLDDLCARVSWALSDGALCAVVTVQGVLQCGAGVVTVQGLLRPHMLLLLLDTGLALSSSLPPHIAVKNFNPLVPP